MDLEQLLHHAVELVETARAAHRGRDPRVRAGRTPAAGEQHDRRRIPARLVLDLGQPTFVHDTQRGPVVLAFVLGGVAVRLILSGLGVSLTS